MNVYLIIKLRQITNQMSLRFFFSFWTSGVNLESFVIEPIEHMQNFSNNLHALDRNLVWESLTLPIVIQTGLMYICMYSSLLSQNVI